MRWIDDENRPSCVVCREIWKEKESDPPCSECKVEIGPRNEDAVEVFTVCKEQMIRAGMSGAPVAPNLPAIIDTIKLFKIVNEKDCLWRVMNMFSEHIQIIADRLRMIEQEKK